MITNWIDTVFAAESEARYFPQLLPRSGYMNLSSQVSSLGMPQCSKIKRASAGNTNNSVAARL
jgi:hypothetical protein